MEGHATGMVPNDAVWEPLPFDIELGFPISFPSASQETPSKPDPGTPEAGRPPKSNLLDPPRQAVGSGGSETWPYPTSGSSKDAAESMAGFVRRRYLETLFLPDAIYTMPSFVSDLLRIRSSKPEEALLSHPLPALIAPLLLPLVSIETKHRKRLLPFCSRCLGAKASTESPEESVIEQDELRVLETGAAFRKGSKAAETDAQMTIGKKWTEELERREVFLQIILTLIYIAHLPKVNNVPTDPGPVGEEVTKKPRKRKRKSKAIWEAVVDDPKTALELLTDRLSIWQAVSDLGIGEAPPAHVSLKGKAKAMVREGYSDKVRRFFDEVLAKYFLKSHYSFCKNFHLKLFGTTLPSRRVKPESSELIEPPAKKSRKSSELPPPAAPASTFSRATSSRAAIARGMRESSRGVGSPPPAGNNLRRSASVVSMTHGDIRSARSDSIDPNHVEPAKRTTGLTRQPSGKNLFQGREVGLMRRTGSAVLSRPQKDRPGAESQAQQTQRQGGLSMLTRRPSESWRNAASILPSVTSTSATLVQATPSKPKGQATQAIGHRPLARNPFFKSHPTTIKEETTYIAETPVAPGRINKTAPLLEGGRLLAFKDSVEDEPDDDLGDLMCTTDEEDGYDGMVGIPETPMKG